MKKLVKWFSIFAAAGTAIGLAVAYFCKKSSNNQGDTDPDFIEDEDFDLDADLQPASGREYVSLNRESSDESAASDNSDKQNVDSQPSPETSSEDTTEESADVNSASKE